MNPADINRHGIDLTAIWDAAGAAGGLARCRKLARRTGLVEAYAASWHYNGGALEPRRWCHIRVHQYRVRATLKAEMFDLREVVPGPDIPREVKRRFVNAADWQGLIDWVNAAAFWQLPSSHRASGYGLGGVAWTIEGFRDDRFHSVTRTTWSVIDGVGAEVFELGKRMADLAGMNLFEDAES